MEPKSYKVSAPGSLMLMGEHAVLSGSKAMVCAVSKRLSIKLVPNDSRKIKITDTRLGTLELDLDNIQILEPYTYVLSIIQLFRKELPSGFVLEIKSDFASDLGFGSSAAVTVATIAVLSKWLKPYSADEILQMAKLVHGGGSGGDLAASVYGGVISYAMGAKSIEKLPMIPDLTAVYCGYKKPTNDVIKLVNLAKDKDPLKFKQIFADINECVAQGVDFVKQCKWQELGDLFSEHHKLQDQMGVSNSDLNFIAAKLSSLPQIFGAKISGSGLGDCVVGLGNIKENIFGARQYDIAVEERGLVYEYN